MRFVALSALLWVICGIATADEYDDAISAAFPGYRIVQTLEGLPEEHSRPEDRTHPAVVVGRFNRDQFEDFAAYILDPGSKRPAAPPFEAYDGGLVVCFGRAGGRYRCQRLLPGFGLIHLPHTEYLERVPPGSKQDCFRLARIRPWEPESSKRFSEHLGDSKTIHIATDALAASSVLANSPGERVIVFQPDGSFLNCTFGH